MQLTEETIQQMRADRASMSMGQLARKYQVSKSTAHYHCSDVRQAGPPALECPVQYKLGKSKRVEELDTDHDFEEMYWQYRDYIGWRKDPVPGARQARPEPLELTAVIGDLHVPYESVECLRWMIQRTSQQAKRCVVIGDLADMFYFAKYMKFKQHFTALEEIKRVQAALCLLSESFEEVVIMPGNHDERFIKYLARNGMAAEVMAVFEYLHGRYALHPVCVLAHHLKNVTVSEAAVVDYAEFGYLYQQGDCIMSHAEKFSTIPNKAVAEVIKSLKSYHEPRGVVRPFKVVIQAHTHQAGKTWNDYGVVGIENGCMALTPDYSGHSRPLPVRASLAGFTELWQTPEGVTDIERTNFIPFPG